MIYRKSEEKRSEFKLREDDILRMARPILPATNLAISKTRDLFSGEPSTTLKVIYYQTYIFKNPCLEFCFNGFLVSGNSISSSRS